MRLISSFRTASFRWLFSSFLGASMARWALMMIVGWQVEELSHSAFWTGMAVFVQMAPAVLIAPLAGVLADRFDRRRVLAGAQALATLATVLLAVLTYAGQARLLPVLLLALLYGIGNTVQTTAGNALIPIVVAPKDRLNGIALQGFATYGSELLGPLLATPIMDAFGSGAAYLVCAALNLVAVGFCLGIRKVPQARVSTRQVLAPLLQGMRYLRTVPLLGAVMSIVGLHCGLTMSFQGVLPDFVSHALRQGSGAYGQLMSAIGLGSMAGALAIAGIASTRLRGRLFLINSVGSGLFLLALGLSPSLAVALAAAACIGATQTMFMTLTNAMLQDLTSDQYRGRVTSLYYVLAAGLMSIANWAYGAVGAGVGAAPVLVVVGGLFVLVTLVASLAWPDFTRLVGGRLASPGVAETSA